MDWHPRFHRLALEGMRHLTLEQRGAYQTCLDLMYEREGPIPDDDRWLSGHMNCSVRAWKIIRTVLVDDGKLIASGEGKTASLMNPKVAEELENQNSRRKTNVENGARGGKTSAEKKAKAKENNADAEATAQAKSKLKTETVTETEEDSSFQSESAREDDFGDMFGGSPPEPKAKAAKVKPFAMPDNWTANDQHRAYAAQNGLTPEETDRAAIDFRDHFADRPSEKRPGWDRSWQRWVRTACDRKRERAPRMAGGTFTGGGGRGPVDIGGIIIRRRAERGE